MVRLPDRGATNSPTATPTKAPTAKPLAKRPDLIPVLILVSPRIWVTLNELAVSLPNIQHHLTNTSGPPLLIWMFQRCGKVDWAHAS